jgi:hypothetical protein
MKLTIVMTKEVESTEQANSLYAYVVEKMQAYPDVEVQGEIHNTCILPEPPPP